MGTGKVKVGIVGLGRWARVLTRASTLSDKIEIVAGYSRSEGKRAAFHADTGVPPVGDMKEMLSRPDIEGVILTVPNEQHLPVDFSDVDLCLRLGALGLRCVYTPYACLEHVGGASRSRALDPRELQLMRERWGAVLANDPYYSPHLTRIREDYAWEA